MQSLPKAELEVMLAVWQAGEDAPRATLEERLADKGWSPNTLNTMLARLCEKGFLACRKNGRANLYTPLISHEEYSRHEGESLLDKLYGSSLKSFVAAMAGTSKLKEAEIQELETLLESLKKGDGTLG